LLHGLPLLGLSSVHAMSDRLRSTQDLLECMFYSETDWNNLTDFVEEHIFKTGRIKGVEWELLKKVVPKNQQIAWGFQKYVYFHDIVGESK